MHSFVFYDSCSFDHTVFCHNIYAQAEPFSFKETAQHDCWKQTMMLSYMLLTETRLGL